MMGNGKYALGLVSVSFRQHTPEDILQAVKAAGLSCVEWGSDVHAPCRDMERLREIAVRQKEHGISCSSYGTYFRLGETPIKELENYIQAAKILGTNILRLWCGVKSGKDMTNEERNALLEACKKAAEIAKSSEMTLCMECHRETFTENPDDAVWLMRAVNSPHFRMYWQPFQWQNLEENMKNAAKVANYAEHIHVFNWRGKEKFPLAEAVEEWRDYLEQFSTPRTLLLEFMPKGTLEELACEAAALRMVIGESV
ncbi:MAG: sugar phosphate isomerase/epimerase [Oscillospiraceae bacterium]|nr:sugar phosphate isomerase/epimerase [Oscillospiraceae bacterium]